MQRTYRGTVLGAGLAFLLALGWCGALAQTVQADAAAGGPDREEILSVYEAFKEAQNARDLERVGAFFIDDPDFLWVSDGQSFYGRETVLARMGRFQKAELWRVDPDLDGARVIQVAENVAILHLTLTLEIGREAEPNALGFLVSIVFRRDDDADDWRIAALLTTRDKNKRT